MNYEMIEWNEHDRKFSVGKQTKHIDEFNELSKTATSLELIDWLLEDAEFDATHDVFIDAPVSKRIDQMPSKVLSQVLKIIREKMMSEQGCNDDLSLGCCVDPFFSM